MAFYIRTGVFKKKKKKKGTARLLPLAKPEKRTPLPSLLLQ
jgi:hypothetical protein